MSDMPMMDKVKSFWDKPEGKTGMVFAAGGILGALLIMAKWGAAIVSAAQNTMVLGAYILAAVAIGYVLMDKRFRTMVFYMYKGVMRFLTGLFVQIDPIAILKTYVDDLKKNHADMDKQIGRLRGVLAELDRKIRENEVNAKNNMALAAQAQKKLASGGQDSQQTMRAQVMLKTRKAGRLEETNRTFIELRTKVEMIYRVLSKMFTNCGMLIEDTEDSIELKSTEWKTIKMAHGAMRSAMNIIRGDKDKRAIYEEALDIMANDLDTKVGEMQRFMEVSQNFLDGIDLQNGVFEEKGLAMLEKWEKDADSWLLGEEKGKLIAAANDQANVLDVNAPPEKNAAHMNQYNQLFQ
jgi:hypothetical protein